MYYYYDNFKLKLRVRKQKGPSKGPGSSLPDIPSPSAGLASKGKTAQGGGQATGGRKVATVEECNPGPSGTQELGRFSFGRRPASRRVLPTIRDPG
jgi:hypothetical protein